jgi:hypothetical protein
MQSTRWQGGRKTARRLRTVMGAVLVLTGALGWAAAAQDGQREVIELIPSDRASWGATNVFAPVTGLFLGGPGYWYSAREIEVDTTPQGAVLDLFYVRANFQKRFEQAEAPILLRLPSRIEAGPRDSITIRALLDGHKQEEIHVKVRSRDEKIMIDLMPLPNILEAMNHQYFSGRGSLTFLTKEALQFRVQKASDGFSVVLTQTGKSKAAGQSMDGVRSSNIKSLKSAQLGEDLVVRVTLTEEARGKVEPRSMQGFDNARQLHQFTINLAPIDGGSNAAGEALTVLGRLQRSDISGCALTYDRSMRNQLERDSLARALAPSGAFTDRYLRAALRRLGELSPNGVITLADGTKFRPNMPIELSAAASRSDQATGYLALLRTFVAGLEPPDFRRHTLRGLIAPEVGMAEFNQISDAAENLEAQCAPATAGAAPGEAPAS